MQLRCRGLDQRIPRHAICFGITTYGLQIWRVKTFTSVPKTDLAILGLELATAIPPDATFYQARISSQTPPIGSKVECAGFRAASASFAFQPGQVQALSGKVQGCAGLVTEHLPNGTDSFLMPWPLLQADFPHWGGMSGGPVFNDRGNLVGILCSSLGTLDPEDPSPSFISLLAPVLDVPFSGGWPDTLLKPSPRSLSTYEVANASFRTRAMGVESSLPPASGEVL